MWLWEEEKKQTNKQKQYPEDGTRSKEFRKPEHKDFISDDTFKS